VESIFHGAWESGGEYRQEQARAGKRRRAQLLWIITGRSLVLSRCFIFHMFTCRKSVQVRYVGGEHGSASQVTGGMSEWRVRDGELRQGRSIGIVW
jgi:hypothetical protein